METNSPADEPTPETPAAAPVENTAPQPAAAPEAERASALETVAPVDLAENVSVETSVSDNAPEDSTATPSPADGESAPVDELEQLVVASQRARLSPSDEERMTALLKEALLGGRSGVSRAIELLPRVPWIVGVRAVETVWPELTAGFRTQLLAGLAKDETDAARRIRLSLARALFKLDVAVSLKVAAAVARELPDKETGALTPKQAQIFANVFVGRGKPWLTQLPLGDLKPVEIDALVHCAMVAVFTIPHPPITQLGVIKWAQEQGRLAKLEPGALEVVKKGLARWSGKWQAALRKEVIELPDEILAMLKPASSAEPAEVSEKQPTEGRRRHPANEKPEPPVADATTEEDEDDDEDDDDDEKDEDEADERGPRKERPVYEPRPQKPAAERPTYTPRNPGNPGANAPRNFNLPETLRQIEAYANGLRAELATAKTRQKDDRRRPAEKSGPIIEGEPTLEELGRLNQQLEARNTELQERIRDLTQHSEDLATSTGAMAGEPVSDTGAQLRTLLGLKLQEDFADFLALEKESNDLVVRQHYQGLLRHVFEILQQLEVPLKAE